MKIGVIVGTFPAPSETFIRRDLTALQHHGCDITVFALQRYRPPAGASVDNDFSGPVHYRPILFSSRVLRAKFYWLFKAPRRFLSLYFRYLASTGPCPLNLGRAFRRFAVAMVFAHEAATAGCDRIHAHFAFAPGKSAASRPSSWAAPSV